MGRGRTRLSETETACAWLAVLFTAVCGASAVEPHSQPASGPAPASTRPAPAVRTVGAWPVYRGTPDMRGLAGGQLPRMPALHWTIKTEGPVKSSAVIHAGRVYIGSNDASVYAINLADGRKAWSYKTEGEVEAPPTIVEDSIVVGSNDGHLYCLAAEDGQLKWKYRTEDKILGAANPVTARSAPTRRLIVGSYDYHLHCVDAHTGKGLWKYETDNYVNGAAAVADGRAVFGGCDGILHVVDVEDGRKVSGIELGAYVAGTAALADGLAFVGDYDGTFWCLDIGSQRPVWKYRDRQFPFFSSAAVDEQHAVFGGRDRRLHCVDRATGKVRWTFSARGKIDSSPVLCGDDIVVGSDDGRLYVVSLADGQERWSYEIGEALTGSPAVADGMIVIGSEDGSVYAFGSPR